MAEEHKEEHGGGESHGGGGHAKAHGGGHGGGGGSHEEHEGAPEWLISFADNVALMMGFFVILLAMNMQKPAMGGVGGVGKYPAEVPPEMDDFAIAMRAAFNNPVDIDSKNPHEAELVKRLKDRQSESGKSRAPGIDGNGRDPQSPRPSDWYKPAAVVFFLDNETQVNDAGKESLKQAADMFKGHRFIVEVRGHVSALEARGDKAKAMQLASDRALAAAQELVREGMTWDQLRIVACGDNERATGRATDAQGHQNNQRVEIVQTQEQMAGDVYNGTSAGNNAGQGGPANPE